MAKVLACTESGLGGSGRFQNAAGSADITGWINVVTFEYNGRINGTISRPNSD